jgi:PucR family transcriptional regulator, purine catabolism regulatory protein
MFERMHNDGATVAELRATTALGRARLVAGDSGTDRTVRRVQWMEVLDDHGDFLEAGDLLLTTAYNLGDDPALQRALATQLDGSGVAAIVIKCGYYLDRIPYVVARQADRIGLPVFELDREVPFVELSQSIYERLVSGSYARLQRSAGIHRELVRLVVEGADLATIVRRAAVLLENPVAVEDEVGRPLAAASADGRPLWPQPQVPSGAVAPVMARGVLHGRVGLPGREVIGEDDRQALEQVATVIALEIAKSEQQRAAEARQVAALTLDLVRGGAGPVSGEHGRALGAALPESSLVVRAAGKPLEDGLARLQAALGGRPLVARDGAELVAIIAPEDAGRVESWLSAVGAQWSAGISEPVRGPALPEGDRQARRARELGLGLTGAGGLHRYVDVETHDALLGDVHGHRSQRLRERTIGLLPAELRETLAVYLESGASASAAGRALFVHRNTVHYRLRRIEQLTGLQLARLEDRMLLELGLLASRVELAGRAAEDPISRVGDRRQA